MAAVSSSSYQRFGPEAVEVAHAEPVIDRGQPAEPQWSSGLFDCLLDLRTSAAVLCCMPTTTAQIFTRVSGGRNPANLCVVLAVLLWLCVLAGGLPSQALSRETAAFLWRVWAAGAALTLVLTCASRVAVRRRDGIVERSLLGTPVPSLCIDCAYTVCCTGCTQCMLLRCEGLGEP